MEFSVGKTNNPSHETNVTEIALPQNEWDVLSCEDIFWRHIANAEGMSNELQAQCDELFVELQAMPNRTSDAHFAKETFYWALSAKQKYFQDKATQWVDALQDISDGKLTEDKAFELLPQPLADEPVERLSKRDQAIIEQRKKMILAQGIKPATPEFDALMRYGRAYVAGGWVELPLPDELTTDPRRIASGRHATKIAGRFDSEVAQEEFVYRTADTHGGKSRNHGKNHKKYIGKSGRSIRKR